VLRITYLRMIITCITLASTAPAGEARIMHFDFWRSVPESPGHLDACERLLIRCFRRWTSGIARSDPTALEASWKELADAVGPAWARSILDAMSSLVFRLAGAGRRIIRHHHPCCPRLTVDELRLIRLVAASQHGAKAAAEAAAEELLGAEGVGPVVEGAADLAAAFAAAGQFFPERSAAFAAASAGLLYAERGTVH
jgi:hypothetical protein